jgi:hypothetical protein
MGEFFMNRSQTAPFRFFSFAYFWQGALRYGC